jgi:hypothetical protein
VTFPPEPELIVAVNCCVDPACTVTPDGEIEIASGGGALTPEPLPPHPKVAVTTLVQSRVSTLGVRFLQVTQHLAKEDN